MTPPLRVVLIGAGTRSRKLYGPWLAGIEPYRERAAQAVAVLDSDPAAAQSLATDLSGAALAAPQDLDRVLADTCPDLVIVATPDATHHQYATRSLAAGCTTLVEKPLATTAEDASALVRAADQSPARLLVGHNLRFTNVHRTIHQLLTSGHIGAVIEADFHYTLGPSHSRSYFTRWHRTRAASGGLEVTKASHHLDLIAWWLGSQPLTVTALLESHHYLPGKDGIPDDADIHDSLHALIQYSSGATVHYALTTDAPREGYTCTLRGTEGTCTVHYNARSGPHLVDVHLNTRRHSARKEIRREEGTHAGADRRMLTALPAALQPGTNDQFATAAEAALAVATGTAIYRSSTAGRRLPVPQPTEPGEAR